MLVGSSSKEHCLAAGKNSGQRWLTSPFSRRVSACGAAPYVRHLLQGSD